MKAILRTISAVVMVLLLAPSVPASITLADWGILHGAGSPTLDAPSLTNETPINSVYIAPAREANVNAGHLYYRLEDGVGTGGWVGPYVGGQNSDVEFLGAIFTGNTLQIAIVSGQMVPNAAAGFVNQFQPGDIRITTRDGRVYGLEVGAGGTLGSLGATYSVDANGNASSVGFSDGTWKGNLAYVQNPLAGQTAGSIWRTSDADWINSSVPAIAPLPMQLQVSGGEQDKLVGYAANYQFSLWGTAHSLIQVSLDWTRLGEISTIAWGPACSNDYLGIQIVPEPASLVAWSMVLGAVGLSFARKRRRHA